MSPQPPPAIRSNPANAAMLLLAFGVIAILAFAQQQPPRKSSTRRIEYPQWEVRTIVPREISPARYRQVDDWELQEAARLGWELVSTTPYALQNEERGPDGRRQIVTQVYPAYSFKRLRELPPRPE